MTSESVDDLSYKLYGITRYAKSMENCSNSGNITIENTEKNDPEYGPALTACGVVEKCIQKITGCSNTGKISGKGKTIYKGEIAGNAGYSYLDGVTVYDNYYTGSGKKSGSESTSWKPYQSKAKKVSSITFGNCSKLSSKYWTYSNKHKRLILKNNKEV